MKLQILCTTMNQKDFSKIEEMNIHSDVVFANQCDEFSYKTLEFEEGKTAVMVNTATKGVGLNRNLSILYSHGDILLFSDDDVVYNGDVEEKVVEAFCRFPKADVIIFGIDFEKNGRIERVKRYKNKRLSRFCRNGFGACQIAVKKSALLKYNLLFNTLFGGGCIYNHGEDSCFVADCLRVGMKLYTNEYVLGKTVQNVSSWYTGQDERYFYDDGASLPCLYPRLKYLWAVYHALRPWKNCELTFLQKLRALFAGMRGYKTLRAYKDWSEK